MKCELCGEKFKIGEGKIIFDKFRNKKAMYCKECVEDYEGAASLFGNKKGLEKSPLFKMLKR